jgi:hypothetical protein
MSIEFKGRMGQPYTKASLRVWDRISSIFMYLAIAQASEGTPAFADRIRGRRGIGATN